MIQSFKDRATEDIYNGLNSKLARKKLNPLLFTIAGRKLDMLDAANSLEDLRIPPSNRLESLKGDLAGTYSIRLNERYLITFAWSDHGPEQVEIVDYH